MYSVSVGKDTPPVADEDSEAGLLEDMNVVIVGVPHGPSGGVALGLLRVWRVDEATVTVSPFLPAVILAYLHK